MTFTANPETDNQMYGFWSAGDLNGDSYEDWMFARQPLEALELFAWNVFWGGPAADSIPDLVFRLRTNYNVHPMGDFNGDGFDDLYVYRPPADDYGEVWFGGNPMDTIPDWRKHSQPEYRYLSRASAFGDVNGDGFADFMSGTPSPERIITVFLGGSDPDTIPDYQWYDFYSSTRAIINDMNNDGADDIVYGAGNSQLHVHLGGNQLSTEPDYTLQFHDGCHPWKIYSIGDFNNDQYNDIAVIDDGCNNLWGLLMLYLGSRWLNSDPVISIWGREDPLDLVGIYSAGDVGDVNGDGIDDLAIGAFNSNFDGWRGRAIVIAGDSTFQVPAGEIPPVTPKDFDVSIYPNPFNAETTIEFDPPSGTGVVNLRVYNIQGQIVHDNTIRTFGGQVRYRYDAGNLSSGVYLLQVNAGSLQKTEKLVLLK